MLLFTPKGETPSSIDGFNSYPFEWWYLFLVIATCIAWFLLKLLSIEKKYK
ncbi:MAG: hypothetical protein AB3N14_01285 [Flavobacteriaceae bacterium]